MAYYRTYYCSVCKQEKDREDITVKKVEFKGVGVGGKFRKSRTVAWLCTECLPKDEVWRMEEYDSPGMKPREEIPNGQAS